MQGELRPGEPNDMMYVKFADQFLAKAQYDNALFYIEQALAMNPNCTVCTRTGQTNYSAIKIH